MMSDLEKLVTTKTCADCEHGKVCRHRQDYLEFVDAISDFSERYCGDKIPKDVASVEVSCNYYTQIKPVVRSSFELR